jgi:type IV pilus assembly protein PilY1
MIKEVIPMKSIKTLFFLIPFLFLIFTITSFAADTDLYVGGGPAVEPNVLIIFDNSGSMNQPMSGIRAYCPDSYSPSYPYDQPSGQPYINPNWVYKKGTSSWFPLNKYKDCVTSAQCANYVPCVAAQNKLKSGGSTGGYYEGKPDNTACNSPSKSYTYATGNWLRFNFADANDKATCNPKIGIARDVIKGFLEDIQGVRIGLMVFNESDEGGHIVDEIKTLDESTNRTKLINDVGAIVAPSGQYTPLAETLYEAGLYFKGAQSYFNSPPFTSSVKTYTSPIQYYCQKNYVIFMTDGMSTKDVNAILAEVGDQNNDNKEPPNDPGYGSSGSDYLDDVAKYLYETDLLPDNPDDLKTKGKQDVATYTIGFELDMSAGDDAVWAKDLLERAARYGGGKFYTTEGSAGLADVFSSILNEVLAKTSSFVAPIVPVSRLEKTTAGDKIYLAFFRPNQSGIWSGNIKKYGVAQNNDPAKGIVVGDILDAPPGENKAVDSNGEFYPSSKSYWTTSSTDGGEVEKGGVGEVLKNRDFTTNPRKIYGYFTGCTTDLTTSCNAFHEDNWDKLDVWLGTSGETNTKNLINFIRGLDAYGDDPNADTTGKRGWLLGSFLHSRPYVLNYADRTVIYAGANDGMFHAFDDMTGEELWAYIPGSLLDRLKELHTDNPGIFVDGSPKAYVSYNSDGITVNKAIIIFGLRRGGYRYYGLDVTDPLKPKFAWYIGGDISGYEEMKGTFHSDAQTWSTPVIGKVKSGTADKWVAFIGGGYDVDQDDDNPAADAVGRAVYVVDVLDGSLVKRFSRAEISDMTYCIPSDIAKLDLDGDGYVDRLYVGDMNGRMWRIGYHGTNPSVNKSDVSQWTAKIVFKSNAGLSEKRKMFYPPDVTLETQDGVGYEMLFFGTGNREDPKGNKDMDRIYAVKDKNPSSPLGETNLVDVSDDLLQDPGTSQTTKNTILANLNTKYGWYIKLEKHDGEKSLASPLVYNKIAYYTSFSPTVGSTDDKCFVGEGTATLYAVDYKTGEAVLNLDLTNDSGGSAVFRKSDRAKQIGTAIPSGVVITVIGGKVTAYVGVGGGVYRPELSSRRSLFPVSWKLVF